VKLWFNNDPSVLVSITAPTRFETTLLLPDNGDLNYSLTDRTKIGFDFQGHGNSYKLTTDDFRSTYAERSIDFSSYVQQAS
jgi:hypothetical protein